MLTQKQKLQVLNFFNTQVTDTLGIVQTCYDEDKTWERQYDATCIINALYSLSSKYTARGYTFTADDIENELANLDTEYRDIVYEAFLRELPDAVPPLKMLSLIPNCLKRCLTFSSTGLKVCCSWPSPNAWASITI